MLNTTNARIAYISQYLRKKFYNLVEKYEDLHMLCGYPKDAQVQNFETHQNTLLQQAQSELQDVQLKLGELQLQLQEKIARVEAMETSKFWIFRKVWFKIKRLVGLGQNE
jgi:hypothetical protein